MTEENSMTRNCIAACDTLQHLLSMHLPGKIGECLPLLFGSLPKCLLSEDSQLREAAFSALHVIVAKVPPHIVQQHCSSFVKQMSLSLSSAMSLRSMSALQTVQWLLCQTPALPIRHSAQLLPALMVLLMRQDFPSKNSMLSTITKLHLLKEHSLPVPPSATNSCKTAPVVASLLRSCHGQKREEPLEMAPCRMAIFSVTTALLEGVIDSDASQATYPLCDEQCSKLFAIVLLAAHTDDLLVTKHKTESWQCRWSALRLLEALRRLLLHWDPQTLWLQSVSHGTWHYLLAAATTQTTPSILTSFEQSDRDEYLLTVLALGLQLGFSNGLGINELVNHLNELTPRVIYLSVPGVNIWRQLVSAVVFSIATRTCQQQIPDVCKPAPLEGRDVTLQLHQARVIPRVALTQRVRSRLQLLMKNEVLQRGTLHCQLIEQADTLVTTSLCCYMQKESHEHRQVLLSVLLDITIHEAVRSLPAVISWCAFLLDELHVPAPPAVLHAALMLSRRRCRPLCYLSPDHHAGLIESVMTNTQWSKKMRVELLDALFLE